MEYEQQPENPNEGFIEKMKNSPRTVSAVIIVLIVAAAIYAFSVTNQQNSGEETAAPTEQTKTSPEATADNKEATASKDAMKKDDAAMTKPATPTPTAVDKNSLMEMSKSLPEEKKTETAYVETAQKGNGLTHLARRAATRYLAEQDAGYAVTNEHRVYIEDYIRKHMPKERVAIGAEKTIDFTLIKEAVDSAGKLSPTQLKNLTKYTHALR